MDDAETRFRNELRALNATFVSIHEIAQCSDESYVNKLLHYAQRALPAERELKVVPYISAEKMSYLRDYTSQILLMDASKARENLQDMFPDGCKFCILKISTTGGQQLVVEGYARRDWQLAYNSLLRKLQGIKTRNDTLLYRTSSRFGGHTGQQLRIAERGVALVPQDVNSSPSSSQDPVRLSTLPNTDRTAEGD
ncbi:MAG: hypothetical protein Q9162_003928 [Coniocarpon cinnabarinum]